MKKIVALLLCALLAALGTAAPAENPVDAFDTLPGEPGTTTPPREEGDRPDHIALKVGDESIYLTYDASPQYSAIQGGLVQASYYAYGGDGTLYEMYISFPDTARAGMVISPEYVSMTNEESSVVMLVTRDNVEKYYFSSLLDGNVYPKGSGFTISIDSVVPKDDRVSYAGTLSATLIALDMASGELSDTLEIPDIAFHFTISGQLSTPLPDTPQPDSPQPDTPQPDTPQPATPQPTAGPEDMRKA